MMRVKLSPLKLEDEAAYSCEITYEEPGMITDKLYYF